MEVRKVKLFNKVNVKEVKNFSLRSQRANLVSSKSDKSKEVKTPLQTHITGTRCEHEGMFVLQNSSEVCKTF